MWSSWRLRSPAIACASSGSNPAIVIEALNMSFSDLVFCQTVNTILPM
jgi:hypothetical protein